MTTLQLPLREPLPFTQERAVALAQHLNKYEASVLIHDGNRTVNARSLLGILSLGILESKTLEFIIDGADEDAVKATLREHFSQIDA